MRKLHLIIWLSMLLVILGLTGCSSTSPIEGASITGASLKQETAGSEPRLFGIQVKKDYDPVGVDFRGTVLEGRLRIQLSDQAGSPVWSHTVQNGKFAINETFSNLKAGEYYLGLFWEDAITVQYELQWRPYQIDTNVNIPLLFLPGVGMLTVAAGFVAYAFVRRFSRKYIIWGALLWLGTVALKLFWALMVNNTLYTILTSALPNWIGKIIFYIYVGLLTGIFEVGITYLFLRKNPLGRATWGNALAFGIGFGAVEAGLLALSPLVMAILAVAAPEQVPFSMLQALGATRNIFYGIAPVWERFFTVWVHIFCNVLLFYAVLKKEPRAFWFSFLFKTLIDVAAAYGQVSGLQTLGKIWMLEGIVAAFGAAGWLGTHWLARRYPEPVPVEIIESAPPSNPEEK
ncbi:MAG TPA: YhfC family glutamic-type intramembrane protease [Anaerolineaceae bacterium]